MENKTNKFEISSFWLHILAMIFMLIDHLGLIVFNNSTWMRSIGRLAFPIFAFLLVEGFYHTVDTPRFSKYIIRTFIFAIISEIPFNFLLSGFMWHTYSQNVMWTYLVGLICLYSVHKLQNKGCPWSLFNIIIVILAAVINDLIGSDYGALGILIIMVFYFFRGRKWYYFLGQFICLFYLNYAYGGGGLEISLFGNSYILGIQLWAVCALPIIWLYKGKQGHHGKVFKYTCYAFYPLHMLIFCLL